MPTTYDAILRGNLIEWGEDAPQPLASSKAVNVRITVLDEPSDLTAYQGQRMAAALEKIAQFQTLADVDAAKWERETRQKRLLPRRQE